VLLHRLNTAQWVTEFRLLALCATIALTVGSGLQYAWGAARRLGAAAANGSGVR
jgi:hypothetical protein